MNKLQELQAARNMEADCSLGAGAGPGKYTREVAERRRNRRVIPAQVSRVVPAQVSRIMLDSDPECGPVRHERELRWIFTEAQ